MKMKKIAYLLIMVMTLGVVSCSDDNYDTLTGNENEGGLLTVKKLLVPYVVGNGDDFAYSAEISAFQGSVQTTSVDIYKKFTNVAGDVSNTVLLKTVTFPNTGQLENLAFTVSFNELRAGLTLNGAPLTTDDSTLNIGDFWTLTYVSKTSKGTEVTNLSTTKVAVGTRFAGKYSVIRCDYWRIGVPRPDVTGSFLGTEVVIESVNSTTYRKLEYAGPFNGNQFYFTIDPNDVVLVPGSYNGAVQLLNGFGVINCTANPNDMVNACNVVGLHNTVVRDDVLGKDKIYMTYGYFTTGSGPREFYEVLEKVVE